MQKLNSFFKLRYVVRATPIRRPSNRAKRVPVSAKGPRRRLLDQLKEKRSKPRKDRQQSPVLPPKEVERVESESDDSLDAIGTIKIILEFSSNFYPLA